MLRRMIAGLARYIASPVTAKHRFFLFLDDTILADQALNVFAFDDAFFLGVLSSRIHVVFSLAAGGRLGVGNDPRYNNSRCFDPFPFPICDEAGKKPIRKLAEELDAHRKRVQAQHGLTLTGLYNVLEKIRAGEKLTDKEKLIHDAGLVSVLKQLHDDLDAAVSRRLRLAGHDDRRGNFGTARRLERRARRGGKARRHPLAPPGLSGQRPGGNGPPRARRQGPRKRPKPKPPRQRARPKSKWPQKMAERVQVVETALHHFGVPATPGELAKQFKRAKPAAVAEILETLATLGHARKQNGKFIR